MTGFRTAVQGQILEVVLDNPKANAITAAMSRALAEVFTSFNADPDLRVAIISGAGERFFSTGADLREIDATGGAVDYGPHGFAGLIEFPDLCKPVIAAVNGLCVGGGFELALACDMIVASEAAQFFLTETRIGNLPYLASIRRLIARLPVNVATEMLYTGRRMSAADLHRFGLVNHVVSPGEVRGAAMRLAEEVVGSGPLSIAACRRAITMTQGFAGAAEGEAGRAALLKEFGEVMASEDAKEGAKAFVENRSPVWKGR